MWKGHFPFHCDCFEKMDGTWYSKKRNGKKKVALYSLSHFVSASLSIWISYPQLRNLHPLPPMTSVCVCVVVETLCVSRDIWRDLVATVGGTNQAHITQRASCCFFPVVGNCPFMLYEGEKEKAALFSLANKHVFSTHILGCNDLLLWMTWRTIMATEVKPALCNMLY